MSIKFINMSTLPSKNNQKTQFYKENIFIVENTIATSNAAEKMETNDEIVLEFFFFKLSI